MKLVRSILVSKLFEFVIIEEAVQLGDHEVLDHRSARRLCVWEFHRLPFLRVFVERIVDGQGDPDALRVECVQELAVAEVVILLRTVYCHSELAIASTLMKSEFIECILATVVVSFVIVEHLAVVQSHAVELECFGKHQGSKNEQHQEAIGRDVASRAHRTKQEGDLDVVFEDPVPDERDLRLIHNLVFQHEPEDEGGCCRVNTHPIHA